MVRVWCVILYQLVEFGEIESYLATETSRQQNILHFVLSDENKQLLCKVSIATDIFQKLEQCHDVKEALILDVV